MHKTITFQTNYNNKLHCDCFTHIDVAPTAGIPGSKLEETVVEIRTADNTHPSVKTKLVDIIRLPLWRISDCLSYPSHGIDSADFQHMMITNNEKVNADTAMAVYFYKKIQ
jgi:hypothetical protein